MVVLRIALVRSVEFVRVGCRWYGLARAHPTQGYLTTLTHATLQVIPFTAGACAGRLLVRPRAARGRSSQRATIAATIRGASHAAHASLHITMAPCVDLALPSELECGARRIGLPPSISTNKSTLATSDGNPIILGCAPWVKDLQRASGCSISSRRATNQRRWPSSPPLFDRRSR